MIEVKLNKVDIKHIEKELGDMRHKAPVILMRSINRVVSNVNKNVKKEVRARYEIKSKQVQETLKIKKASRSNLVGLVESRGSALPLYDFKVSPKEPWTRGPGSKRPKIYKSRVLKGGSLKGVTGMFVQRMSNGHVSVFTRINGQRDKLQKRYTISVPEMIKNEEIIKKIETDANKVLKERVNHEIKNLLARGQ